VEEETEGKRHRFPWSPFFFLRAAMEKEERKQKGDYIGPLLERRKPYVKREEEQRRKIHRTFHGRPSSSLRAAMER
jgi:hypothetical protein